MALMPRVLDRGARGLLLAAAAGPAGFALQAVLPDRETVAWFFNYPVYFGVIVVAMALSLLRAVGSSVHRAGWAAIAVAIWSLGTAEFVWELVYSNLDDPPYPSWADLLYLGFYPASYVGVVLLFRARARGVPAGIWLDGLTAALAAGAIGAAVLVEVVLDTTSGSLSTVATNLAYPLGDVFLLALVVGAFSVTRWRPGGAWLMIGAALAVAAIGDSIYLFQTARGTYVEGTLLDVTWPTALLLMAWAGWLDRGRARPVDATGRAFLAVPAVCAVLAVAVLVLDHFRPINLLAVALATSALAAVVGRLVFTFRENGRLLDQARLDAITDPVTGLGNRRRFVADLEMAVAVAEDERPWLLVIFDLDGFKGYNDSFGHPSGDQLLARLGHRLASRELRDVCVYRLGGDEFCLLAPVEGVDIEHLVDEAVKALTERGAGFEVTSSFGAVLIPEEAAQPSEALRLADARLYAQKHGKRATRSSRIARCCRRSSSESRPSTHTPRMSPGLQPRSARSSGSSKAPSTSCIAPRSCTTSASSLCRTPSSTSRSAGLRGVGIRPTPHPHRREHPDGLSAAAIGRHHRAVDARAVGRERVSRRPRRRCDPPRRARDRGLRRMGCDDERPRLSSRAQRRGGDRELERGSGTQFDPAVVRVLVGLVSARALADAAPST